MSFFMLIIIYCLVSALVVITGVAVFTLIFKKDESGLCDACGKNDIYKDIIPMYDRSTHELKVCIIYTCCHCGNVIYEEWPDDYTV